MKRGISAALKLSLVCSALGGCDELLGVKDTVAVPGTGGASAGTTAGAPGAARGGNENASAGLGAAGRQAAGAGPMRDSNDAGAAGDAGGSQHDGTGGSTGSSNSSGAGGAEIVDATAGEGGQGQAGASENAGAGAAGAGPGTVAPDAFGSQLALWLAPEGPFLTTGTGTGVVEWHDRSPNGLVAAQANPEFTPVLSSTALAGHPGVVFDGMGDFLSIPDGVALELGTHPFALEIVFSHTTDPNDQDAAGGGIVFSKQLADYEYTGIGVFVNRPISALYRTTTRLSVQLDVDTALFTPPNVAYNDGRPRMLGMRRSTPDDFELRLNGKQIVYGVDLIDNPISVDASPAPVVLGSNSGPGQSLRGVISEVVLVRDATDEQFGELEAYLLGKYGSVLAP